MEPRRRIPRWKILIGIVGSIAFVVGSLTLWIWWAAERRWAEMRSGVLKVLHEEMARPAERPVLRGTPEPGNAWDDYDQALAVIARMSSANWSLLDNFYYRGYPDSFRNAVRPRRATLEPMMVPWESALTHLRKGAGQARAQFLYRDESGMEVRSLKPGSAVRLGYLAAAKACFLADDGKATEAAELLLDFGQFVRDYSHAVHPYVKFSWNNLQDVVLDELCALVRSGRLSPEMLLRMDRELDLLDRSIRLFGPMDPVDLLRLGFGFLESDTLFGDVRSEVGEGGPIPFWGSWRFGFSDRLMVADALGEGTRWLRTCESLRTAPWAEVQRTQALFREGALRSPNPVVRVHLLLVGNWRPISRIAQARIRLLRIAAVHKATGEFLELEDPFGGTLRHRENGCGYKLWSVGCDGNDDDGDGVWAWKPTSTNIKDIVLEIER